MQFCGIDGFGRFIGRGSGGGAGALNIFTQIDEPEKKEGIWVKTAKKYKHVIVDNNIFSTDGEWQDVTTIPITLSMGCACIYNNVVYVAFHGSNKLYKLSDGVWTLLCGIDANLLHNCMCVCNDKIYYIAGKMSSSTDSGWAVELYCFNPSDNTISKIKLPHAAKGSCLVTFENEVHYLGGYNYNSSDNWYFTHYKYNGSAWTDCGNIPIAFSNGCVAVYDGVIHMFGGKSSLHYSYYNGVYTNHGSCPINFAHGACINLDNKIHLLSGTSYYTYENSVFTAKNKLPFNIDNACAVLKNENINVFIATTHKELFRLSDVFEKNTVIIQRGKDHNGNYKTCISDTSAIGGENSRFTTAFNDAHFYGDDLETSDELYYGDGTQWVKFKN